MQDLQHLVEQHICHQLGLMYLKSHTHFLLHRGRQCPQYVKNLLIPYRPLHFSCKLTAYSALQ
ncbi:hypothetical protein X975_03088, partial [Stegodyphus mimosarum]